MTHTVPSRQKKKHISIFRTWGKKSLSPPKNLEIGRICQKKCTHMIFDGVCDHAFGPKKNFRAPPYLYRNLGQNIVSRYTVTKIKLEFDFKHPIPIERGRIF